MVQRPLCIALLLGLILGCGPGRLGDVGDGGNGVGSTDGGGASDGGSGADGGGVGDTEPPELAGILAAHNEVRAGVGVAPLVWDSELAAVAQAWAEACVDNEVPAGLIDHNDGRSDTYPGYVGENIYGSSGSPSPVGAVNAWASEVADYDIATNTCSGVCGHYTQIVWDDTARLGCGIHRCSGLTYGGVIVCNYSPGGNVGGRRPYPYP